jgi:hypothetical protein
VAKVGVALDTATSERENTGMWWVNGGEKALNESILRSRIRSHRVCAGFLFCVVLVFPTPGWPQNPDSGSSNQNQSWTSTSETRDSHLGSSTRTSESHSKNGNSTVDKKTVEILRSGSYQPYQETELETTQVDASTTRTTVRTYGRDSNGNRILTQVTDEEKHDSPGGAKVVRTTSNPDANGRLAVVQRQVEDTHKVGANAEVTKTTTYLPGGNGGLVPSMEVQERREKIDDHTTKFQKSTMLSDGNGNWQVGERKDGTITDDGKKRAGEEHVARQDGSGNLNEVSRTVSRESRDAAGQSQSVVETYSKDVPGGSSDGSMHLVQRVTASQNSANGGQTTHQQVEQVNPGNPSEGLQVTVGSTGSEQSAVGGTSATNTVETRDADGRFRVVSVDLTKSDRTAAVQVQIAPVNKPK